MQKLTTDKIFSKLEQGEAVKESEIDFVTLEDTRTQLYKKIMEAYPSMASFAEASSIYPSPLHYFLTGKKNLSRDKVLAICITLKLDIAETRETLRRLIQSDLYPRDKRDFVILQGIRQKNSLYDINDALIRHGFEPLTK